MGASGRLGSWSGLPCFLGHLGAGRWGTRNNRTWMPAGCFSRAPASRTRPRGLIIVTGKTPGCSRQKEVNEKPGGYVKHGARAGGDPRIPPAPSQGQAPEKGQDGAPRKGTPCSLQHESAWWGAGGHAHWPSRELQAKRSPQRSEGQGRAREMAPGQWGSTPCHTAPGFNPRTWGPRVLRLHPALRGPPWSCPG